jgi:hypothetical protein
VSSGQAWWAEYDAEQAAARERRWHAYVADHMASLMAAQSGDVRDRVAELRAEFDAAERAREQLERLNGSR